MATATKIPLASITLTGTASSISFNSISQSYTDLVLVICALPDSASTRYINFVLNDDNAGNYSNTQLGGDNGAQSNRSTGEPYGWLTGFGAMMNSTTNPCTVFCNFNSYSSTSVYKTSISKATQASAAFSNFVNLWRNTSAINSITISVSAGNFASGSTFNLYGIL